MAQYNLGKVSIRPRGAYAANTSYDFLDTVSRNGGAWLALAASKGVVPGESSGWQSYWMAFTKGITSVQITAPSTGKATITITFSDGTSTAATIDTAAIGAGAVGTTELADGAVTKPKLGAGSTYTEATATLLASGWSNNQQTVNVTGVTSRRAVIAVAAPDSFVAYCEATVRCSAQGAGTLTFTCEDTPSVNLSVFVLMPT